MQEYLISEKSQENVENSNEEVENSNVKIKIATSYEDICRNSKKLSKKLILERLNKKSQIKPDNQGQSIDQNQNQQKNQLTNTELEEEKLNNEIVKNFNPIKRRRET